MELAKEAIHCVSMKLYFDFLNSKWISDIKIWNTTITEGEMLQDMDTGKNFLSSTANSFKN